MKLITLKEWSAVNIPADDLIWQSPCATQIQFIIHNLSKVLNVEIQAIGIHRSKSIVLPVYYFELVSGERKICCVMRNNFYNWNVSIISEISIPFDIIQYVKDIISVEDTNYCFYEGFPKEFSYLEPISKNEYKFSFYCQTNYELFAFFHILTKFVK